MRLTTNLKLFLLRELDLRCEQLGILIEGRPKLIFTRKEVLGMPVEVTRGRRTSTNRYLGVCYTQAQTLFINIKKIRTRAELRHVLIHELVHFRFRYLNHGTRFEERIKLIIKGKTYMRRSKLFTPSPTLVDDDGYAAAKVDGPSPRGIKRD